MPYTQQQIEEELAKIRQRKINTNNGRPPDYKTFAPATLGTKPQDDNIAYSILDSMRAKDENLTDIERTKGQNRDAFRQMRLARQGFNRAQNSLERAQNRQPSRNGNSVGGNIDINIPQGNFAPGKVGVGVNLGTYNFHGRSFTVNRAVAPKFLGFLNALWQRGYRPASIGGYNNRNIAGTNTKSLHAYGLAIDIDPGKNPVQRNDGSMQTSLPPRVGALAAKYGLSWGGSWHGYKDPMHFSVPYGGRE